MNQKTIEGQMTLYKDPRLSDSGLNVEIVEAILAAMLSGEKVHEIAKKLSIPRKEIEQVREEYAQMTLKDIRAWHSLGFINKSWELIWKAFDQIKTQLSEANAKDAATILSKLHDKQLVAQEQLEISTQAEVEGSDDEIKARILKIEKSLRKERMFDVEDAEFEETADEPTEEGDEKL